MTKKIAAIAIVSLFILSSVGICAAETSDLAPTVAQKESTKDRISRGVSNIFYGPVEMPKNMDQTKTKGTKLDKCEERTRTGLERGIGRVFTGVWQLATFWNSDPGCVTSSSQTASGKAIK